MPLGAWEDKRQEDGSLGYGPTFLVRPGMRFEIERDDVKTTAARGVGVNTLHENRKKLMRAWKRHPMRTVTVQQPAQFQGAKLSVVRTGDEIRMLEKYGNWVQPEEREISYDPCPKRPSWRKGYRFDTWALPVDCPGSAPYGTTPKSELAEHAAKLDELRGEQHDGSGLDVV